MYRFFVECASLITGASKPLLRITGAIKYFHEGFSNTMKTRRMFEYELGCFKIVTSKWSRRVEPGDERHSVLAVVMCLRDMIIPSGYECHLSHKSSVIRQIHIYYNTNGSPRISRMVKLMRLRRNKHAARSALYQSKDRCKIMQTKSIKIQITLTRYQRKLS